MKNYADQGDCFPPRQRGNAIIDGWSIPDAAFVSQQEDQTIINLISNQIYHQINSVLLSSSNLVNAGWLWQLSQGSGVNQKQRRILKE